MHSPPPWNFALCPGVYFPHGTYPGGPIRVFGVGLLAVAALAAAGLWFQRRRADLVTHTHAYRRGELDGLRAAGL